MPSDQTDLDALIEELGQAHLNLSFAFYQDDEWFTRGRTGKTGTISANLRRAEVAREALRARLAPTTDKDDSPQFRIGPEPRDKTVYIAMSFANEPTRLKEVEVAPTSPDDLETRITDTLNHYLTLAERDDVSAALQAHLDSCVAGARAQILKDVAALRARLAPTTQSWVKETCADCRNQFVLTPFRCVTCSSERLNALELRTARQTAADATARAEKAERALAECRAKTIEDACAALKAKQAMLIDVGCDGPVVNAFSSAMGVIRALKTKEPT